MVSETDSHNGTLSGFKANLSITRLTVRYALQGHKDVFKNGWTIMEFLFWGGWASNNEAYSSENSANATSGFDITPSPTSTAQVTSPCPN